MLLITIFFYKEPPRQIEGTTLGQKLKDIYTTLSDLKFLAFLVLLGLFFWLPFWAFFNLWPCTWTSTSTRPGSTWRFGRSSGPGFANFFSQADKGRGAPDPGGDHLPRRLHHHDLPGARLRLLVQRVRPSRPSWSGWRSPRSGFVVLGYAAGLRAVAGLPGDLPVRRGGDDHLAADPGVHHLARPQGEGRPVHGLELPGHRDRRRDERRHLHVPVRLRERTSATPSTSGTSSPRTSSLAIVVLSLFVKLFGEFREQEA